jgi:hypothetical protein
VGCGQRLTRSEAAVLLTTDLMVETGQEYINYVIVRTSDKKDAQALLRLGVVRTYDEQHFTLSGEWMSRPDVGYFKEGKGLILTLLEHKLMGVTGISVDGNVAIVDYLCKYEHTGIANKITTSTVELGSELSACSLRLKRNIDGNGLAAYRPTDIQV